MPLPPTSSVAQLGGPVLLNVPYDERKEASKLGARWNGARKKWTIPQNHLEPHVFAKWMPRRGAAMNRNLAASRDWSAWVTPLHVDEGERVQNQGDKRKRE